MSSKLPNLWILENSLLPEGATTTTMRRAGESPVRVLETNVDFPLTVNGDVNKGPNGNKRGSLHDHHHDHDAESAAPTDTMLTHPTNYPLPNDDEDDDDLTKAKPGKLQKVAHKHGLTKKGLLLLLLTACMCALLLVTLLVMAVMWPRDLQQLKMEVCLTPDCLRASAQVDGLAFSVIHLNFPNVIHMGLIRMAN